MTITRYGIISDTHGRLNPAALTVFDGVQRIYHCGDICNPNIIMDLETVAPVLAVFGNCDPWSISSICGEHVIDVTDFGTVCMYHGTRYGHSSAAIMSGLANYFSRNSPRLILFGHTHEPLIQTQNGILFLNPGSASIPHHGDDATVAILEFDDEKDTIEARHVAL